MIEAVFFDMDGVLIDSEKHWEPMENEYFSTIIPDWSPDKHHALVGLGLKRLYAYFKEHFDIRVSKESLEEEVSHIAHHIYETQCSLIPGVSETLEILKKENKKLGLVSSAKREWIDTILERFNLKDVFDLTLSSHEISGAGKPAPDVYLHAASLVGTGPENCAVIEDSTLGVQAGKAAGMLTLGFRNGFNEKQDLSDAGTIIGSMIEMIEHMK